MHMSVQVCMPLREHAGVCAYEGQCSRLYGLETGSLNKADVFHYSARRSGQPALRIHLSLISNAGVTHSTQPCGHVQLSVQMLGLELSFSLL